MLGLDAYTLSVSNSAQEFSTPDSSSTAPTPRKPHKKRPQMSVQLLTDSSEHLKKALQLLPNTGRHTTTHQRVDKLLRTLEAKINRLKKDAVSHASMTGANHAPIEVGDRCDFVHRDAVKHPKDVFSNIGDAVIAAGSYVPVPLEEDMMPDVTASGIRGRRWKILEHFNNLELAVPIELFAYRPGGNAPNAYWAWQVPANRSDSDPAASKSVADGILKELPNFISRQQLKAITSTFRSLHVHMPASVLRVAVEFISGGKCTATDAEARRRKERAQLLLETGDEAIILDERSMLSGRNEEVGFTEFWKAAKEEVIAHTTNTADERRHGGENIGYLPMATSIADFRRTVIDRMKRKFVVVEAEEEEEELSEQDLKEAAEDVTEEVLAKHGWLAPSEAWVAFQFVPKNASHLRALHDTQRLPVRWKVQTRQLRGTHPDGHYATAQLRYAKSFAVRHREYICFTSGDDKCKVAVGEPDLAISTGVRARGRAIVPEGEVPDAGDHDFNVSKLIPSVVLFIDVPDAIDGQWYHGTAYVTVKDAVFHGSTPERHAAEYLKMLKAHYGTLRAVPPALMNFTDGGGDRNTQFYSVLLADVSVFLKADLDLLVHGRPCAKLSYMNWSERVMSVLNLALQHVSLKRITMAEAYEKVMESVKSMADLRVQAGKIPGLEDAFRTAVKPVIVTILERFLRQTWAGKRLQTVDDASDDEIEAIYLELLRIDNTLGPEDTTAPKLASKKLFLEFKEHHVQWGKYCIQIFKVPGCTCAACEADVLKPLRMPQSEFEKIKRIPFPVPQAAVDEEGEMHYMPFDELYGTEIGAVEKHCPSLEAAKEMQEDAARKGSFGTQCARTTVMCNECFRYRIVFSKRQLTEEQDLKVEEISEDGLYTCGGPLMDVEDEDYHNVFVREKITCSTPMEGQFYTGGFARDCGRASSRLPPTRPQSCAAPLIHARAAPPAHTTLRAGVCGQCGATEDLTAPSAQSLAEFSFAAPLCAACLRENKEWVVGKRKPNSEARAAIARNKKARADARGGAGASA